MAGELVTYTGRVPAGGLRWVRGHPADQEPGHGPQMFLVPVSAGDHAEATYDLHDLDVVLFQVFAETAPTAEGILAFAARYGRLGIDVPIRLAAPDASGPMPEPRGEPLTLWQREISPDGAAARRLAPVPQPATRRRRLSPHRLGVRRRRQDAWAAFRSHVTVEPQEGREGSELTLGHLKTHETIATMDRPFDAGEVMPPNDVLRYALSYVQQRLDVQLRRHEGRASPSMTLHPTRGKPLLPLRGVQPWRGPLVTGRRRPGERASLRTVQGVQQVVRGRTGGGQVAPQVLLGRLSKQGVSPPAGPGQANALREQVVRRDRGRVGLHDRGRKAVDYGDEVKTERNGSIKPGGHMDVLPRSHQSGRKRGDAEQTSARN